MVVSPYIELSVASSMATEPVIPVFAALSTQALVELSDARGFVSQTVVELLGASTSQSESDLSVLQALVDHDAMRNAKFEAWVTLGIAFGDALIASVPGLRWCLVTDQFGTHAALQFKQKALSISAPTMLWKRVERGEPIDLAHMTRELRSLVVEHAHEYRDA
jgi:hypothetical protein